ncbi:MAG: hypothetical protein EBV06_09285 [Planctomycetia bacterium]|nr:hypothetical protein [Planctomycetia bacterium]
MPELTSNAQLYFQDLPLLIIMVSLVYSATRYEKWSAILVEAARWIAQLLFFLGGVALALYILTSVF